MKPSTFILARVISSFAIVTIFGSASLVSQPSASSQVVTLEVVELNKVMVSTELLMLESSGSDMTGAEDSVVTGQTRLVWTSNGGWRKVSVTSRQATRSCIVRVNLQDVNGHVGSNHELELSDASTYDLIRGLSKSAGSCGIKFSVQWSDPGVAEKRVLSIAFTVTSS